MQSTCLSSEPELQVLACLYHDKQSDHVVLTCGHARSWRWLPAERHGVGIPSAEAWGPMAGTCTPSAATHLRKTVLQLRMEYQDRVRQRSVSGLKNTFNLNKCVSRPHSNLMSWTSETCWRTKDNFRTMAVRSLWLEMCLCQYLNEVTNYSHYCQS